MTRAVGRPRASSARMVPAISRSRWPLLDPLRRFCRPAIRQVTVLRTCTCHIPGWKRSSELFEHEIIHLAEWLCWDASHCGRERFQGIVHTAASATEPTRISWITLPPRLARAGLRDRRRPCEVPLRGSVEPLNAGRVNGSPNGPLGAAVDDPTGELACPTGAATSVTTCHSRAPAPSWPTRRRVFQGCGDVAFSVYKVTAKQPCVREGHLLACERVSHRSKQKSCDPPASTPYPPGD